MTELARLSQENRELRSRLAALADNYDGMSFEELVSQLRRSSVRGLPDLKKFGSAVDLNRSSRGLLFETFRKATDAKVSNAGELFDDLQEVFATGAMFLNSSKEAFEAVEQIFQGLHSAGLIMVHREGYATQYNLSDLGRRFRNQMSMIGDREERRRALWSPASGPIEAPPSPVKGHDQR